MSNTSALISPQPDLFIPSPAIVPSLIILQLSLSSCSGLLPPGALCGVQSPLITGMLSAGSYPVSHDPHALGWFWCSLCAEAWQMNIFLSQSTWAPVGTSTLTSVTLLPAHDSQR